MPTLRTHVAKVMPLLTAGCNMRCTYCYQGPKTARRMSWDTLRSVLDLALASTQPQVEVVFYGGEPLLELPLIRRAVEYVAGLRPVRTGISFGLITNGTLLRAETIRFLAEHAIDTQWSFDGVRQAQDLRGRGTFRVLDGRLETLRRNFPEYLARYVAVSVTVPAAGLPYLADSFDYLVARGVERVRLSPVFTHEDAWTQGRIRELRRQFARIVDTCIESYAESGSIPFVGFAGGAEEGCEPVSALDMCGVGRGDVLAVDPDGLAHGCATWTDLGGFGSDDSLRSRFETVALGAIDDPAFPQRYASFPRRVSRMGIVGGKEKKYSSYGKCGECRHLSVCSVCPTSIVHIPGNTDPDRVPDYPCAFNIVAAEAHERFRRRVESRRPVRPALSLAFWTDRPRLLERREPHA